jgi:hypothetical protein
VATYYVRTTGNDSTGDGSTGNPWATPGKAVDAGLSAADVVKIGPGTYTLTTATPGAGGPVSISGESENTTPIIFQAEDPSDPPVISVGAITSISVFASSSYGGAVRCEDIHVDGQSNSNITAFNLDATSGAAHGCKAIDCTYGFGSNLSGVFLYCEAEGCDYGFSSSALCFGCTAHDGGVGWLRATHAVSCLAYGNSSHGFYSDGADSGRNQFINCIAYGNGGNGFHLDSYNRGSYIVACISVGNTGYGYNLANTTGNGLCALISCAAYGNTSGATSNYTAGVTNINFITLSADPFVNAAAGDFNLNNVSGGGADLRDLAIALGA